MNNKYVSIDQYKNHKVYLHHEYKIPSYKFLQSNPVYQNPSGLSGPDEP